MRLPIDKHLFVWYYLIVFQKGEQMKKIVIEIDDEIKKNFARICLERDMTQKDTLLNLINSFIKRNKK